MRTAHRLLLAPAAAIVLACSSATEPSDGGRLAEFSRLVWSPDVIALPDTVAAGTPFTLVVPTLTGQCRRTGRTDVVVAGQVAAVTVYQDTDCSDQDVGVLRDRAVAITFEQPGTSAVRVTARDHRGPQTVERYVVVR